jgi:hypothetical protein
LLNQVDAVETSLETKITASEVQNAIQTMKNEKTSGTDKISIELEKYCMSEEYINGLVAMYNRCLTDGCVPGQLKTVIITTLHKSGNTFLQL